MQGATGVLAIELSEEGIHAARMPVPAVELNQRFVLAYTGVPRNSGTNNWEVMTAHIDGDKKVHKNFDQIDPKYIAIFANQLGGPTPYTSAINFLKSSVTSATAKSLRLRRSAGSSLTGCFAPHANWDSVMPQTG